MIMCLVLISDWCQPKAEVKTQISWFLTRFTRKILDYSNGSCLSLMQFKKIFRAIGKACLKSVPSDAENRVRRCLVEFLVFNSICLIKVSHLSE